MGKPAIKSNRDARDQSGFVISVGFILFVTILVIGLAAGIATVRNAWFKRLAVEASRDVYVIDENNQVLGKALDFDEHEAPLVPFVDYDAPDGTNRRVLVGIRDDRFSSRERVYYTDTKTLNCTGQPCIFSPSTEISGTNTINSVGVDEIQGTGGVSYQIATQAGGGPGSRYSYAIGSTDGGLPGRLYRQTEIECQIDIDPDNQTFISYWQSQRVVETGGTDTGAGTNPPCYTFLINQPGALSAATRCQDPYDATNANCCTDLSPVDKNCPADPAFQCLKGAPYQQKNQTLFKCDCPMGWFDPKGKSGFCCPPDSDPNSPAGQCQQASKSFLPAAGDFLQAEEVIHPATANNVLDGLGSQFRVSLPVHPDDFVPLAPAGE